MAEGALRQPGADHLTSPQSDPFESSTGQPSAQTNSDGDEEVQIQEAVVNEEDESQQKIDPDSDSGDKEKEQEPVEQDFWSFSGEALIRHHRVPRSTLFVPTDPQSPLPTKYLDVLRTTYTDLETQSEKRMEDFWNKDGNRALSDSWRGKTVFYILRKPPPPGWTYIYGRKTKLQQTTRPGNLWPEVWKGMSKAQKRRARINWVDIAKRQKEARDSRGIYVVPADDKEYDKLISELKVKLAQP